MAKSRSTAVILSVLIAGVGQMYLGEVGRGVAILIIAIVLGVFLGFLLPFYLSLPVLFIYYIWQIYDAYKLYDRKRDSSIDDNITCDKCDLVNPKESEFCNKCGNRLRFACPQCKQLNNVGVGYCGKCGTKLESS